MDDTGYQALPNEKRDNFSNLIADVANITQLNVDLINPYTTSQIVINDIKSNPLITIGETITSFGTESVSCDVMSCGTLYSTTANISTLNSTGGNITTLSTTNGNISSLVATSGNITTGSIPTLISTSSTISSLTCPTFNCSSATISNLTCSSITFTSASITNLTATNATISSLTSPTINCSNSSISSLTSSTIKCDNYASNGTQANFGTNSSILNIGATNTCDTVKYNAKNGGSTNFYFGSTNSAYYMVSDGFKTSSTVPAFYSNNFRPTDVAFPLKIIGDFYSQTMEYKGSITTNNTACTMVMNSNGAFSVSNGTNSVSYTCGSFGVDGNSITLDSNTGALSIKNDSFTQSVGTQGSMTLSNTLGNAMLINGQNGNITIDGNGTSGQVLIRAGYAGGNAQWKGVAYGSQLYLANYSQANNTSSETSGLSFFGSTGTLSIYGACNIISRTGNLGLSATSGSIYMSGPIIATNTANQLKLLNTTLDARGTTAITATFQTNSGTLALLSDIPTLATASGNTTWTSSAWTTTKIGSYAYNTLSNNKITNLTLMPSNTNGCTATTYPLISSSTVPASDTYIARLPCLMSNNSNMVLGTLEVNTSGVLSIYPPTGGWASGNCGILYNIGVSYKSA